VGRSFILLSAGVTKTRRSDGGSGGIISMHFSMLSKQIQLHVPRGSRGAHPAEGVGREQR
jgi:hypothetical protein